MDGNGTHNLEVHLGFTVKADQAKRDIDSLRDSAQHLSRSAQDAQQQLGRLSKSHQASQGGTYEFAGGAAANPYSLAPVVGGGGPRSAYAQPFPHWQAGAAPTVTGPTYHTAARVGPGGTGEGGMGLADLLKIGLIVEAVHKVVEALDQFGEGLKHASVMRNAAGQPLSEHDQRAYGVSSAIGEIGILKPLLRLAVDAVAPDRAERAARERYDAELAVAQQPTRFGYEREREQVRRNWEDRVRSFGAANAAGGRLDTMMPGLLDQYNLNPELARAQAAAVLPQENLKAAEDRDWQATRRLYARQVDVQRARAGLEAARDSTHPNALYLTPLGGAAVDRVAGDFGRVEAARNRLLEDESRLKDALNQKDQTAVQLAQAKLDAQKATTAAARAQNEYDLSRVKGTADQFGLMDFWGQRNIVDSVRKWKEQGISSLGVDERNLIASTPVARDQFLRELELAPDANRDELFKLLGVKNQQQLEKERGPQVKEELKEQVLNQQVADAGQKTADRITQLLDVMNQAFEARIQGIEQKLQQQRIVQGG